MNKFLFPNLSWLLLLLIPFTFLGFYPSYFSKLLSPVDNIYHIHALLMVLWVALAIIQPFLIQQKKTKLHKVIGKASYLIMPLVFIAGYFVIRHTYFTNISSTMEQVAKGLSKLTPEAISAKAAAAIVVGLMYFIWLLTFYLLAVINRKKILFHATYMFAAILTILGPTVERLTYTVITYFGWPYNFIFQNGVLFSILLLLVMLIIYQRKKGNSVKPATIALSIYAAGILVLFFLPDTIAWQSFVELIM